ncbi:LPXTG cell wall anchor domain-containing protein [Streptococcus parasanguinis]|uniref:glycosyl hydrolase n=1 Tax=Streptococcus parasanguinis TaxID=1318 RepID=UPI001CBCF62C|nr:glycosyl hydrolase [Streptococcus parasanguinis]MBZ2090753.1 LPXTG cell wall anchor domain-containing protein [Streptococcus parasanguinis]
MKQGMKKQLALIATVSGIFLFSPVVLAAEEQNAPTVEEVTGGDQVSSETSTLSEVATSQGTPTVTASSSENTATGQTSETRLLAMTDDQASQETKELYAYLKDLNKKKDILFGQQHALDEGVTLTSEGSRVGSTDSDVKNAVGDYPAVFGWDTLSLDGYEKPGVSGDPKQSIANLTHSMKTAHQLGGIITMSTHPHNFVTGGDFNDTSGNVVQEILPGGSKNNQFNQWLDRIAELAHNLKTDEGKTIPVIFRPFHEQTGSWFWWGESTTNPEQYKALYRYTVEYLRDQKGVHNFLYAYSPGAGNDRYFKTYPGDAYVDVLGIDSYDDKNQPGSDSYIQALKKDTTMLVKEAEARNKIAALTEFGYSAQGLKNTGNTLDWYTRIFNALQKDPAASKIAYMMTWANFGMGNNLYTPYRDVNGNLGGDHELLADFQKFYQDPHSVFLKEVGTIYGTGKQLVTVPHDSTRYVIQPGSDSIIKDQILSIVAKAKAEDTKVTARFNDQAPLSLSLVNGFYTGTITLPENAKKEVAHLVLDYYQGDRIVESQNYRLFVKRNSQAQDPLVVDDFEDYLGERDLLERAYASNGDPIMMSLEKRQDQDGYRLVYDYQLDQNGYAGRQLSFDKNWSEANAIQFELDATQQGNRHLTVQIQIGGVSFEKDIDLSNGVHGLVTIPLSEFKPAHWESHQSAQITKERLKKVTQFALYLGGDKGKGQLKIDTIKAITDPTLATLPEKEADKTYEAKLYPFDKESADWQGEGRTVSGGTMRVSLPLKKDDKVEVKTSQISDLSSYDWYVVRVKSSQPLSAKLFIKVGDSWQWVDSGSQELSEDYKELRFDLSAVEHRDATREVGIEFYKSTDEAGDSEVTIDSIAFVKSLDELVAMKPKELPEAQPSPLPEKEEHTEPNNPEEDHPQPQAKPTDEEGQFAFKGAIQSPISSKKEETNGRSKVSKEAVADDNSTVSKVMVAEGSKFDSQKQGHSKLLPNTGSNPSILAILSGMVFTMLAGFIKVFYKNDKF